MKKIARALLAVVILSLVFTLTGNSTIDASLASKKKEAEKNISSFKKELDKLDDQSFEVSVKIEAVQTSILKAEKEILELEKDLVAKEKEFQVVTNNYNKRKAQFYDHLRNKYEQGDIEYISVVLDATNLTEVINYNEYYRIIKEKEAEKIKAIQVVKASLEEQKKAIENNKQITIDQKNSMAVENQKLLAVKAIYDANMETVRKEIAAEEADIAAILKEIAALNRPVTGNYTGNGRMQWPVPSIPPSTTNVSKFRSPSRPRHNGLDIGGYGVSGRTIVASEAGEVILSKSYYGYGNTVIIDHNNGMVTLYAHLASDNVQVGQKVTRGQVIGIMGNTGQSSGIHLHFEVIINGAHVNPEPFIR